VARVQVGFDRNQQALRRIRILTQNRLAPDHDELALVRNRRCRAQDVLKRGAVHDG
jgi:hypothetical protein